MFCSHCGANNPDGARFCGGCGQPPAAAAAPPPAQYQPPAPPPYQPPPPQYQQPPQPQYAPPQYQQPAAPPPGYGAPPPGYGAPPPGYGAAPYGAPPPGMPVPDVATHAALAIITTLLCCLPIGAFAWANASKVKQRLAVGDYAGAQEASRKAKMYSIIGMILGPIASAIYVMSMLEKQGAFR